MALLLQLATGCDPCMNNPCNDGLACNGVETCTVEGNQAVCGDGTPVQCDPPEECTEPDGSCVGPGCTDDFDCDDGDLCTTDTCADGTCTSDPVACDTGFECDPDTGECVPVTTTTPDTLLGSVGTYGNVSGCGDNDTITLSDNNGTLILSGLTGNNDITLTLTNDTTATADNVTAFGQPGHTLTLTLLPTGELEMTMVSTSGQCGVTLTPVP